MSLFYALLCCILRNLAYYMAKRMEWVTKQARLLLPYGMLLTRLFTFIMNENPELNNESYVLYDNVMTPLAAQLEQKPRRDRGMRRGRHSTSSSSAFDQPSSSHLTDDDDDYGNDKGIGLADFSFLITHFGILILKPHALLLQPISSTLNYEQFSSPHSSFLLHSTMNFTNASSSNPSKKIKLTIIPPRQLFVNISSDEEVTTTPSPTTTYSSPSAPNTPSKTTSTKETTSSHENTSSSFQSKLQISPTPTNEPTSPQTQNPFLQNLMDVSSHLIL
ncbi:hypothetical protein Tco_1245276 [Tanacetum coccineum]